MSTFWWSLPQHLHKAHGITYHLHVGADAWCLSLSLPDHSKMKLPQLHLVVKDRAAMRYLCIICMVFVPCPCLLHLGWCTPWGRGCSWRWRTHYWCTCLLHLLALVVHGLYMSTNLKNSSLSPRFSITNIRRSKPCPFTCTHGRLRTDTDASHDGAHAHAGNSLCWWIFYVNLIGL